MYREADVANGNVEAARRYWDDVSTAVAQAGV